jgi:short-subunit dehydrogenase
MRASPTICRPQTCPRVYTGTLAHSVAWTQQLHAELESGGIRVQVVCPGVVATEFHERPGVEQAGLLQDVFDADLAVFADQSPALAQRYRTSSA